MGPWSQRLWIGAALLAPLLVLIRDGTGDSAPLRLLGAQALLLLLAASSGPPGLRRRWLGSALLAWGVAALAGSALNFFVALLLRGGYGPVLLAALAQAAMAALAAAALTQLPGSPPVPKRGAYLFALAGVAVLAVCAGGPLTALNRWAPLPQIAAVLAASGAAALPAALWMRPHLVATSELAPDPSRVQLGLGLGTLVLGAALASLGPSILGRFNVGGPLAGCPPGTVLRGHGPWASCVARDAYRDPLAAP